MNATTGRILVAVCLTVVARADRLDGLVKRSPFRPETPVAASTTQPIAASRIEFGGYMVVGGKPLVSLCDNTTGQAVWVALKDADAAYFVESLDVIAPAVSVRLNGAATLLGLRKANTDVAPVVAASPAATSATVRDPGASATEGTQTDTSATTPKNRIPPQTLRIPKRADDPV